MKQNPTWIVLSSMHRHQVRCLLMGGQACVFYGAAEFSRDVDFAILHDAENIAQLRSALAELGATAIAVPPFDPGYLDEGLAIHFRCSAPGVDGLRVDIMSVLRGVDMFDVLWERRTTMEIDGVLVNLLSLPDLVTAKKTQRAKDWPMLQRLVEANWIQNRDDPTPKRVDFWLRECRTPELLVELVHRFRDAAERLATSRPLLRCAMERNLPAVEEALDSERKKEIEADRAYWDPLKRRLESLRMKKRQDA